MKGKMRLKDTLKGIRPYRGGPSKRDVSRKYGFREEEVIKLSSNENPLGVSEKVLQSIRSTDRSMLNLYPDTFTSELRSRLSKELGVLPEQLIFGAGCDEVLQITIQALVGKGDEVVIQEPTFPLFESILRPIGAKIRKIPFNQDFSFDADKFIEASTGKNCIICNPNNPTGTLVSIDDIRRVLDSVNCLILDETYYLFSGQSALPLLREYENLIICRSLSKDYGITALRIGYGVGNTKVMGELEKVRLPYNVNSIAEKAAVAALEDKDFINRTVELALGGREYLEVELKRLGFKTYPSGGNYILIQVEDSDGFTDSIMQRGISVRNYGRYDGFEKSYVRISVGTMEQNKKLIDVLKELGR